MVVHDRNRATMKIPAGELAVGHTIRVKGRQLRVVAVDHDIGTAVLTAEVDFLLHFARFELVDVVEDVQDPSTAA
jgi:hypothetical protein